MRSIRFSALLLIIPTVAAAQSGDAVRVTENFAKDAQYHVACQVEIGGALSIPDAKTGKLKTLKIVGKSILRYDERILRLTNGKVDRTLRHYRQLDFERKVNDEDQHNKLRPEAARLVITRHKQYEVPFCPSGPLTPGEIELVRTDVFAPALVGLFPERSVRVGDRWRADNVAVQELTDLEKIDKGELNCIFDKITTFNGRRNAHVNFEGKIHGLGEDGNAMHELRGSYYVDLDANFLSYVYVRGTHHLLDKTGVPTGKIEGTFVMTRMPTPLTNEVGDQAVRGVTLDPTSENTLLLFDQPQLGVRFTYPRNWRIAGANGAQIGIDENKGSGVLLTLASANATPSGLQFLQETQAWIVKEKATVLRSEKLHTIGGGWEMFSFDAIVAKERVLLQYYVMRQGNVGATLTARLLPADLATTQRDVERIARSVQMTK
jgi:hypothetical protein